MSTRRSLAPRAHVVSGHWPRAELDDDHAAATAQAIARRLAGLLAERECSLNAVSKRAGINRQTVANVLEGRAWATVAVIADLERALDAPLWPAWTR